MIVKCPAKECINNTGNKFDENAPGFCDLPNIELESPERYSKYYYRFHCKNYATKPPETLRKEMERSKK